MFKKFARIWLEVVSVGRELLQDISEKDAKAEGCYSVIDKTESSGVCHHSFGEGLCAVCIFKNLWNSINEKSGYGWDHSQEVDVIGFKRIDKN